MNQILALREKRANLWNQTKAFLDSHRGEDGMVSAEDNATYEKMEADVVALGKEIERLEKEHVGTSEKVQELLRRYDSTELKSGITLADLVRRPELSYDSIAEIDPNRPELPEDVTNQVNIHLKYGGYITRQMQQVEKFKKMEGKKLDLDLNYAEITGLRKEAIQKLLEFQPSSIGQASRISGVTPADISVLLVYLEQKKRGVERAHHES